MYHVQTCPTVWSQPGDHATTQKHAPCWISHHAWHLLRKLALQEHMGAKKLTSDTMMSISRRSFLSVVMSWSGSRWIPTQQPLTKILVVLKTATLTLQHTSHIDIIYLSKSCMHVSNSLFPGQLSLLVKKQNVLLCIQKGSKHTKG